MARKLFISFPSIPQQLKAHMLYALLNHQVGTGKPFFAQAVQRCDREQLVGPEAVQRMFAYDVGLHGLHIHTSENDARRKVLPRPGSPEATEVMHHIEFYMRNLHATIGSKGDVNADRLKIISGTFLFISTPDVIRDQIFAPELTLYTNLISSPLRGEAIGSEAFDLTHALSGVERAQARRDEGEGEKVDSKLAFQFKKPLPLHIWQAIKQGPDELTKEAMKEYKERNLSILVEELVKVPNAAVTDSELSTLHAKLSDLSAEEQKCLQEGLAYAIVMRKKLDAEETIFLAKYPKELFRYEFLKQFSLEKVG